MLNSKNINTKQLPSSHISKKINRINDLLEYIIVLNGIGHSIEFLKEKIVLTERNTVSDSINVSINLMAGITVQYYKAFNATNRDSIKSRRANQSLLSQNKIFLETDVNLLETHKKIKKFRNRTFAHMEENYDMNLSFFNISDHNNIFITCDLEYRKFESNFLTQEFLDSFLDCAIHVKDKCKSEVISLTNSVNSTINNDKKIKDIILSID